MLLLGCAPKHLESRDKVFISLGQAPQTCAKKGYARIDVFVQMDLPPQDVHIKINKQKTVDLYGSKVHLELAKVEVGQHELEITIPGYSPNPFYTTFSVWNCDGDYIQ